MLVVTGATGELGRRIVEQLVKLTPANGVVASARDPAKAAGLTRLGVEVRQGDFTQPESLASAFKGASQVLIVSSNAAAHGGDPLAQHRIAINAARVAGASRIVYTSHMAASASSAFPPMHTHAATEAMLRESGLAWTALRHGFYANAIPRIIGDAASSGTLTAPQDGKVAWTSHDDLAAAAALILTNEGRFEGATPALTSVEALDLSDIAVILGELGERSITRQIIPDAQFAANMASRGLPPAIISISLGMFRASRAGEFVLTDPTLGNLIGRKPISVREILSSR